MIFVSTFNTSELATIKPINAELLSRVTDSEKWEVVWLFDDTKVIGVRLTLRTLSDTVATSKVISPSIHTHKTGSIFSS